MRLDRHMFDEAFPRIVDSLERARGFRPPTVPMYFVCKRAREIVKVALIGQGPDELFGGYKRHLGVQYGAAWRSMPHWLQALGSSVARNLPRNDTLKRGVQSLGDDDQLHRFQQVFSIVADGTLDSLFKPELLMSASGSYDRFLLGRLSVRHGTAR